MAPTSTVAASPAPPIPMASQPRAPRIPRRPALAASRALPVLVVLAAGCGDLRAPEPTRPDDGLLDRPELQEVVDRQVARDPTFLIDRLSDPDPAVRARATLALASVGVPGGVAPVVARLRDSSAVVRRDAAFALGRLGGGGETDAALRRALAEEVDDAVRREVIASIGLVGSAEAVADLAGRAAPRRAAERVLALSRALVRGESGPVVLDRLREALTHADAEVRAGAAYGIGRVSDPAAWAPIADAVVVALDALEAGDPAVRRLVEAVGRAGLEAGAPRVTELLASAEDWRTRVEAARALAFVGNGEASDDLLAALDDPSVHVRVASAEALARRSPGADAREAIALWIEAHPDRWRVAAPLLPLLADDGERLFRLFDASYPAGAGVGRRITSVEVLGRIGGEGAVARLEEALRDPAEGVATVAVGAVVRDARRAAAGGEALAPHRSALRAGLHSPHAEVQEEAAGALLSDPVGRPGDPGLIVEAYRALAGEGGGPARLEALLRPLARADDETSLALLREELDHPFPTVRGTAAFALSQRVGRPVSPSEPAEGGASAAPDDAPALPAGVGEGVDWELLRELGPRPRMVVEVEGGRIVLELDVDEAPMTVSTVATLAGAGLYDGVPFHRVVPNFVVQGGDVVDGDGSGRAGFRIPTELTTRPFGRGTVGMASAGRDTEAAQYFVTHGPQPHLDGGYTAFGTVVEGQAVLDAVARWDPAVSVRVEPGR